MNNALQSDPGAIQTKLPNIKDVNWEKVFSKDTAANDDRISILRLRREMYKRGSLVRTSPLSLLSKSEKVIAKRIAIETQIKDVRTQKRKKATGKNKVSNTVVIPLPEPSELNERNLRLGIAATLKLN